jgi:hypothetical protein
MNGNAIKYTTVGDGILGVKTVIKKVCGYEKMA